MKTTLKKTQMDVRKADFRPQGFKYRLTTEDMDPSTVPSPPQCQPAKMAAITLLNEETMTNSESSWVDPFQGEMKIISRIIDKSNYSVGNMTCTPTNEGRQCPYVKTGNELVHLSSMHVTYHGFQSF